MAKRDVGFAPLVDIASEQARRGESFRALLREILTHTHATARLPAELLERVKAAVGE